jgi:ribosomal protein L14
LIGKGEVCDNVVVVVFRGRGPGWMCGDGVVGGAVLCRREALFKRRNGSSNRLKFKDIKTLVLPFPRSSDRTTPYQLIIRAEIASKNGTTEAAPVAHQRISVTPKWYAAT